MGLSPYIPTYHTAMSNRLVSTTENVQRLRLDVNPPPGERIYYIIYIRMYTRIKSHSSVTSKDPRRLLL